MRDTGAVIPASHCRTNIYSWTTLVWRPLIIIIQQAIFVLVVTYTRWLRLRIYPSAAGANTLTHAHSYISLIREDLREIDLNFRARNVDR